ncbi:hypothetical protein [Paenibacillus sp. UNC451MF]|uniref:hypothetical protein n=1 Tax=Paenibacillus sp. UNC451MF TaxID=1449063 RepID=UPI00048DC9E5|nr:hypothetical protein [Paenibacillus sp. UNC451MF]
MRKVRLPSIHPYLWLAMGLVLLSGLFYTVYTVCMPKSKHAVQLSAAEATKDKVKVFQSAAPYKVLEDYKSTNTELPQFDFGKLQIAKSKVTRGIGLTVKKAHVIKQYAAPDGERMVYFVQREQRLEGQAWTQIDMVAMDPQSGQPVQEPIAYTFGQAVEPFSQSTQLCGFVSDHEFLYTTVINADQEWVYQVNKMNIAQKTITPVMELFRYEPIPSNTNATPVIYSAMLTPDKKHLFIRDSVSGITNYDLQTGAKKWMINGSNEIRSGEHFELLGSSGIAIYGANRYQSDLAWIDMNEGSMRQPFVSEQGFVDPGTDAKGKVMYYNFTYDRATDNILQGDSQSLLLSYGVQLVDFKGNLLKRFVLPKDSKERLEFGGYSESKKAVLLHKYTVATNSKGAAYKKTVDWLIGDMSTGAMTVLKKVDVPDSWDKSDIVFGKICMEPYSPAAEAQVFVNVTENSYYMSHWKTRQVALHQDEDVVMFVDVMNKRVFTSSFTRPDLIVAAFSYKKYNWDNQDFGWMKGHWMARYQTQPEGDKIFFFQIN